LSASVRLVPLAVARLARASVGVGLLLLLLLVVVGVQLLITVLLVARVVVVGSAAELLEPLRLDGVQLGVEHDAADAGLVERPLAGVADDEGGESAANVVVELE
jgi:hypothetical protein